MNSFGATSNLYVVKRTFVNPKTPAEPLIDVALPATFTDLKAAKRKAKTVLEEEGYDTDFFSVYEVNDGNHEWAHGDGVVVYAEGPTEERFYVKIETVPDLIGLEADVAGRVKAPLYHVLQTVIEYNEDRSGSQRYSIVEGTHTRAESARKHAAQVLLDGNTTKADFIEYDEYSDEEESAVGADVVVHAVKEGGQIVLVSVISDH